LGLSNIFQYFIYIAYTNEKIFATYLVKWYNISTITWRIIMLYRIKKACKTLNGAKKEVAVFTLSKPDAVAFMTIDEVANNVGVSASTVSRAAVEMGYKGFPEMQEEVRVFLRQRLLPTERMEKTDIPEDRSIFRESVAKDIENIKNTIHNITDDNFNQAVSLLCNAKEISVTGLRSQYGIASFFSLLLEQARGGVNLISLNEARYPEQLMRMTSEDLFFVVSFPRYARLAVEMTREAEKRGCRIIALTDSPLSPVGLLADVVLSTEYDSQSFFNSTVAASAVVNALVTGVVLKDKTKARKNVELNSSFCRRWNLLMDSVEE
jgi:DNA-binding MurR/RpiR family transcriptional regulator